MLGFGLFTRRELYTIVRGAQIFRYSSGDKDVTVGNVIWKKLAIKRGQISSSSDLEKNTLEVTFAVDSAFAQSCLRSALEEVVFLTLSKYQNSTISLLWQGRLTSVKPDEATIKLTFENDYTSLARAGARYKYQRTCAHDLYGSGCKLNKDNWKVKTTLASVNGSSVVLRNLSSYADSYFRLGMLQNSDGVYVGIEASSGNNITLIRRHDSLASQVTTGAQLAVLATKLQTLTTAQTSQATAQSDYNSALATLNAMSTSDPNYANQQAIVATKLQALTTAQAATTAAQSDYDAYNATIKYVYVYPGCMKSLNACNSFNNTDNFMGFPFIPEDNPTTTRII